MAVREGLLALLSEESSHGYQLKTGFEAATGGLWPLNVGQVYKTLERLERDGLVEAHERDGQRSYHLTPEGAAELGAWWVTVPEDEPPPRDELMLKVMMAVPLGRDHAIDVITSQRDAVMTQLQQRRRTSRRQAANGPEVMAAAMVSDALVVRAEADLRWLDLCEDRLLAAETVDEVEATKHTRTTRRGALR